MMILRRAIGSMGALIVRLAVAAVILTYCWRVSAQDVGFQFSARHYLPGGYADGTTSGEPNLYGYGLGSLETSFYDPSEKVFYGGSELGFVTVSDFANWPEVSLAPFGIPLDSDLTDLVVCGNLLIFATKGRSRPGTLYFYTKSLRAEDETLSEPQLIQSVEVGYGPDYVLVNQDCSIVATANEGEGVYDDSVGLINPEGSISIVRGPFDDASSPPIVTEVSLNEWTDDELIAKGVHLSLSRNALIYFNDLVTSGVDFSAAIASYTTASILEPEYLAWSANEAKIYANLQENNALVIIDVATGLAESIHSYGLKDWSQYPLDVGSCSFQTVEGLKSLRSPDAIVSFSYNGVDYIVTANEGDDTKYGDFEERVSAGDLFVGTSIPAYPGITADASILDPTAVSEGYSSVFNTECDKSISPFCSNTMRLSLGSSMVNYSDPTAPNIYQMVGIGGRGISIYSISESTGLSLVWDSGDEMERVACETIGAGGGGSKPETVVIGEACGVLYAATSNEQNGFGYLYSLADIESPRLVTTFQLSSISDEEDVEAAYAARTLGEVDAESVQFLSAQDSPTGKPAILFSGALSGTVSLWEFDCSESEGPTSNSDNGNTPSVGVLPTSAPIGNEPTAEDQVSRSAYLSPRKSMTLLWTMLLF